MSKVFHVTAPDGHVVEVTGPDDATEEQAIQQAQQQYKPPEKSASFSDMAKSVGRGALNLAMAPGKSLVEGARELGTPGSRQMGLAHMLEGVGKAGLGIAAPEILANPGGALAAAGIGTGISKLAGGGASMLGASPETSRLAEDIAPMAFGGGATKMAGKGLQRLAEPFVRLGLKLPASAHDYGAQPEEAALRLTKGTDPADIEKQANAVMGNLTNQRNANLSKAGSAGVKVPLAPARALVNAGIQNQQAGNDIPREMFPMREHLTVPHQGFGGAIHQPPAPMVPGTSPVLGPNGQPIPTMVKGALPPAQIHPQQSPMDYQGLKQILQQRFTKFTPGENTKEAVELGNQVHHQMGEDLERAVPGTKATNRDIQSLIPVAKRAHQTDLNAGPLENAVHAGTVATGRLAAPAIAGSVGGPAAAAATFGAQQAMANPRNMLRAARGLYGMGGQSNAAKNVSRVLPLALQDNEQ